MSSHQHVDDNLQASSLDMKVV